MLRICIIIMYLCGIISCQDNKKETKSHNKSTNSNFSNQAIQLYSIPDQFSVNSVDESNKSVEKILNKSDLGLPSNFVSRDFLNNIVGYKDKLNLLVGMVVKKDTSESIPKYTITQDFKFDTTILVARIPSDGVLVEKTYDSKIGTAINYLIATLKVERKTAFQFLIEDVSEVTIENDNQINKAKLYETYHDDPEENLYYIIRAATTSSVIYKKFTYIDAEAAFDASAIKVGANYYSQSTDFSRDWKIGFYLTSVKEFLKGYKPN